MNEALATIANLTPPTAILVIAGVAAVGITQVAKQQTWSKQRTQLVALVVATVLGLLAAVILGFIVGIPDRAIAVLGGIVVSIAAVAVLGKVFYGILGYVIPDGTTPAPVNPLSITVNGASSEEVAQGMDTALDVRDALDAPLVDTVAATADARHGRRAAAGVRATHAPVDEA